MHKRASIAGARMCAAPLGLSGACCAPIVTSFQDHCGPHSIAAAVIVLPTVNLKVIDVHLEGLLTYAHELS